VHAWPGSHGQPPPQSTLVSIPFFTPSLQLGALHTLIAHTALAQSADVTQALPSAQGFAHAVPQSTSGSAPFLTPSLHVGTWHRPPLQTPLVQSVPMPQALPSVHGLHEPPQSTSVSLPSLMPSSQVAGWQTPPSAQLPLAHCMGAAQG
jgi:hypothetical protein